MLVHGIIMSMFIGFGATAAELQPPVYGGMLQEYYLQKIVKAAGARRERLAQVATREQALVYQAEIREKLAKAFGKFPERNPLNAKITGVDDSGVLRLEKITFESRPGLIVSANLWMPKNAKTPLPGILLLSGHWKSAKYYLHKFAQEFALNNYVVLVIDPIGQGERLQFNKIAEDLSKDPVYEHTMLGKQMLLLGDFFGAWQLYDAMRALDYLASRSEVNPEQLAVTGCSGGGTMSSFLLAFDRRLAMGAPSCYMCSFERNVCNELTADSEQIIPGALKLGIEEADLIIAAAPRPVVLLAQDGDQFDLRGTKQAYEDIKKIYTLLGAPDAIRLHVGTGTHGYPPDHRDALLKFFARHTSSMQSGEPKRNLVGEYSEKDTWATPAGSVLDLPGSRRVQDFLTDRAKELAQKRGTPDAATIRKIIAEELSVKVPAKVSCRMLTQSGLYGKTWTRYAINSEPGMHAILSRIEKESNFKLKTASRTAIYIGHLSSQQELVSFQHHYELIYALDVRGSGDVSAATGFRDWRNPYWAVGSDYYFSSCAELLGENYLGGRVLDTLAAVKLLREYGAVEIDLIGCGVNSVTAALAAVLDGNIHQITLIDAPKSWHEMAAQPVERRPQSMMLRGILTKCDLPDIYKIINAH